MPINPEKEFLKSEEEIKEKEGEREEKKEEFPKYLPDEEKSYSAEEVKENFGFAINVAQELINRVKEEKEYKNLSDKEILSEMKERIQNVGKYEKKENQDNLYDIYSDFKKREYTTIDPAEILIGLDYLSNLEDFAEYEEQKIQMKQHMRDRDRRGLSAVVEPEGGILKTSMIEKIFDNPDMKEDLKKAEIAYQLLKDYCLDEKTKTKLKELEAQKEQLMKDEETKKLLDKRVRLETQLEETKNKEKKESLIEQLFLLSEKLNDIDRVNEEILKIQYEFNDNLKEVLENYYSPDRIYKDNQKEIYNKIKQLKSRSFEELLENSSLKEEKYTLEGEYNREGKTIVKTGIDKIRDRLQKAGINEISEIEKYALEFVELLDRRKGFIRLPELSEMYRYALAKSEKAGQEILSKNIDFEKIKAIKKELSEKNKRVEEEAKETEKIGGEKEARKEEETKEEGKVKEEEEVKTPAQKGKELQTGKRGVRVSAGKLSFLNILGEMLGEFLKKFWETLKKNKDKFKKPLGL